MAFRHLILKQDEDEVNECDPADFHYQWSDSVFEGVGHEAWEAFRESAKSQYILRSFPIYQLTFPTERFDYIVIIKNNSTLAANKLKEISKEWLSNKIACANLISILQQSGDVFHVKHTDRTGKIIETRIEAYGKGASIRGASYQNKRPKIAVIDDPQDIEDAKSEVVLEADWNWFMSDVMFLGKTTRIFLIGNNLGDKCIVERVIKNAETLGFKPNRVPIEVEGKPTWPAKYSYKEIVKEKEAFKKVGQLDTWLRERMCLSTSAETQVFNMADFPRYSHTEIPSILRTSRLFGTLDPAASTTPGACYRAICINAVTVENYWMLVDMPFGRWDSTRLIDEVFKAVTKYNLKSFGIEKGLLFDFMKPFLLARMVRDQVFFELVPLEHAKRGTKLERIKMLAPRSKTGSIWLPDYSTPVDDLPAWTTELELELLGVTKDLIKSEYSDLMDALAMQDQIAVPPSKYGNPPTPGAAGAMRQTPSLQRSYKVRSSFG